MKRLSLKYLLRRHGILFRPVVMFCCAVAAMLPVALQAQSDQDSWQWRATFYGWLPDIKATVASPTGGSTTIEIPVEDVLDNLDFTFMGALQVRKGSWGFFTDVAYFDLGATKSASREFTVGQMQLPAGVDANLGLDLKSWLVTLGGIYNLSESSQHTTDLLFGARMVDIDTTLTWSFNGDIAGLPLPGRSGSSKVAETIWDAIIGIKGHTLLDTDSKWFIPYHLDVGTGDSDLTWQAMAGIGHQFGWGDMVLTYRYLEYQPSSDSPTTDLNFSGPMIGASFKW